jgi:type II secretory pathway pseudopilin PulG
VATLVVMLLIAVALAVTYVSMRAQTMTLQVQSNADLRGSARDAAMTGMAVALKSMQTSAWCQGEGVSTMLSRSLGDGRRFQAGYSTGDVSLVPSDSDYSEYPYRVTVDVTGYAAELGRAEHETAHHVRAVVRLVPRAVATEPAGWSDIRGHTFCQWSEGDFKLTVPFRIEGPVRVRARLDLSDDYLHWSNDHRAWYFSGLNSLRLSGQPDCRPFTGPVKLTYQDQESGTRDLLNNYLGVTTEDAPEATSVSWPTASLPSGYRLYPGGKVYPIAALPGDLRGTTLEPDATTNPLGVFSRAGRLRVYENVTVRGMIFLSGSSADLEVYGTNVKLTAVDLPPLQGPASSSSAPVRLPTVFAQDDIILYPGSQAQVTGLAVAMDRFRVEEADQNSTSLTLQGRMAARHVQIERRSEWGQSSVWWSLMFSFYYEQRSWYQGILYFPSWLQQYCGLNMEAKMKIQSDSSDILYHWQNPNDPVYVPHPDDATALDPTHPGLRWEVVAWMDNPPS